MQIFLLGEEHKTKITSNSVLHVPGTLLSSLYMKQVLYFLHFADKNNEA